MDDILFTWYQALQLLALGPCLFMLFFLCVTARRTSQILVPALYFLSLTCSFCLPLLDIVTAPMEMRGLLLMGESLTPAFSFLLIMQFIAGRVPPLLYWSILAVPLAGGSSLIYVMLIDKGELCIYQDQLCTEPAMFKQLYEIFSSSLTFLLTVFIYNRKAADMDGNPYQRQHKYALIVALIALNLALLAINLAQISGHAAESHAAMAVTIVRIGFIYLVLTSVFRVFDRSFQFAYERVPHLKPSMPSPDDLALAERIRALLVQEKLYRSMELSREKLAAKLAVSEHHLSRVINQCLDQNFSMLINFYRVQEAKERLASETTAITVIAFEVGFSSIPSFNRVFKQMVELSPSEYRSKYQAAKSKLPPKGT